MEELTAGKLLTDVGAQLNAIDCGGSFSYSSVVTGTANPGLEVEGLGRFGSPLYDREIQLLKQKARQAPFGKGEETVVDTSIRNTWEIDAAQVNLKHPDWNQREAAILESVCMHLGVPGGSSNVRAELYILLVYEEGAHFKAHQDSEKAPGMFATMVICIPSAHQGGDVVVSFGNATSTLSTSQHSEWNSSCLAWYSDVVHEVRPVESGARVVLTYNLVYKGQQQLPNPVKLEEEKAQLRQTLHMWRDQGLKNDDLPACLAYPFEHEYSEANITLANLKRQDRARALCASQVAESLGLDCLFAVISKCETHQEDEEVDSEAEDDTVVDCKILDFEGRMLLENVELPPGTLASQGAWAKGAYKEKGGYTGNAGMEYTYWYKDCALLLLPRVHWVDFQLNAQRTFNDKRNFMRAQFDGLQRITPSSWDKDVAERMLYVFFRQAPDSYRWGLPRDREPFMAELLQRCVHLGLVSGLGKALRGANSRTTTVLLQPALNHVSEVGFDTMRPCFEAMLRQCDNLQERMERLAIVEAGLGGQASEIFGQWRQEQNIAFLRMPLGKIDDAVPMLIEMALVTKASSWIEETLLPALSPRTKDARLLLIFCSDLLARAISGCLEIERAANVYRTLLPTIIPGITSLAKPSSRTHSYWGRKRKSDHDKTDNDFSSSDLKRLFGDCLTMHQQQLMPDAIGQISSVHERLMSLAASVDASIIIETLLPYLKEIVPLMSAHGIAYTDPSFQDVFTVIIHNGVYRYVLHEPKPPSLMRTPRGCRNCQWCQQFDAFMHSTDRTSMKVTVRYKYEINHLNKQYSKTPYYGIPRDDITTKLQLYDQPYTFEITKLNYEFDDEHRLWTNMYRDAHAAIVPIASKEIFRDLLGTRYRELACLGGVVLKRGADGKIVTPPAYVCHAPTETDPFTESMARETTTVDGIVSNGASLKRKSPMDDQENAEPQAKRKTPIQVIDLCDSP